MDQLKAKAVISDIRAVLAVHGACLVGWCREEQIFSEILICDDTPKEHTFRENEFLSVTPHEAMVEAITPN